MLSRRDKLYVQPWEDRRYKDHRSKVLSALPAIDSARPAARAHVAVKLKQWQREQERARRVAADNRRLLQRLAALMASTRLDNRWHNPPPKFQHKVGLFFDASSLSTRLSARPPPAAPRAPHPHVKCYACHLNKQKYELNLQSCGERRDSLPSINSLPSGTSTEPSLEP